LSVGRELDWTCRRAAAGQLCGLGAAWAAGPPWRLGCGWADGAGTGAAELPPSRRLGIGMRCRSSSAACASSPTWASDLRQRSTALPVFDSARPVPPSQFAIGCRARLQGFFTGPRRPHVPPCSSRLESASGIRNRRLVAHRSRSFSRARTASGNARGPCSCARGLPAFGSLGFCASRCRGAEHLPCPSARRRPRARPSVPRCRAGATTSGLGGAELPDTSATVAEDGDQQAASTTPALSALRTARPLRDRQVAARMRSSSSGLRIRRRHRRVPLRFELLKPAPVRWRRSVRRVGVAELAALQQAGRASHADRHEGSGTEPEGGGHALRSCRQRATARRGELGGIIGLGGVVPAPVDTRMSRRPRSPGSGRTGQSATVVPLTAAGTAQVAVALHHVVHDLLAALPAFTISRSCGEDPAPARRSVARFGSGRQAAQARRSGACRLLLRRVRRCRSRSWAWPTTRRQQQARSRPGHDCPLSLRTSGRWSRSPTVGDGRCACAAPRLLVDHEGFGTRSTQSIRRRPARRLRGL